MAARRRQGRGWGVNSQFGDFLMVDPVSGAGGFVSEGLPPLWLCKSQTDTISPAKSMMIVITGTCGVVWSTIVTSDRTK